RRSNGRSGRRRIAIRSPASAHSQRPSKALFRAAPMRSRPSLLLIAVVAVALGAPAGATPDRSSGLPTRAPAPITVPVALGHIGPLGRAEASTGSNGEVASPGGFEIALARALAAKLGLKLRIVDVPFAQTTPPGPKQFDVSFAHVPIPSGRAGSVDFSPPYLV